MSVLLYLQPLPKSKKMIGGAAISVKQINDETMHMLSLAYENVNQAFDQLLQFSDKTDEQDLQKRGYSQLLR